MGEGNLGEFGSTFSRLCAPLIIYLALCRLAYHNET